MSKRNLKRVAIDSYQSQSVDEEARKHQNLLDDYFVLQKESVSMQKKLQTTKQKREILMEEVEFLRQRHRCLMDIQSRNLQPEQDPVPPQEPVYFVQYNKPGKPPRPEKKPKNGLINDKRVVKKRVEKKKILWQDESASMEV